uniref:Uncharacterized protein n=1 Tax=Anguilla anguilla TaxID=7936 RepID=A0A0E9VA84_ANGAN
MGSRWVLSLISRSKACCEQWCTTQHCSGAHGHTCTVRPSI